ncbi:uncharacterized protein LOC136074572 [Hydra vulgaris]|uniref:Uncharacterized protein LOC136074572 n=1 Tax=Hydra vulgaris TaxID=6087 RepID=A0ABM4B2F6_HYDVU
MTATDGLPFKVFITSNELRKSLVARGFDVPKSSESSRQIVMKYATKIRNSIKEELSELHRQGNRLSLKFDEWTSSSPNSNELANNLAPLISKVRKVVKLFRRSPTKNETLQVYVKTELGNNLSLILDNKTRWNSLLFMLERFYKLKNSIQKALIDLNSSINFTEPESELILSTVSMLLPVKLAKETLCRRDANLLSADATLAFMLQNLGVGPLSNNMKTSLIKRIKERRTSLSYLIQYLHKGDQAQNNFGSDITFNRLTKTALVNLIVHLIQRLSSVQTEATAFPTETDDDEDTIMCEDVPLSLTLKEQLDIAINNEMKMKTVPKTKQNINDLIKMVRKELSIFEEDGGTRGTNLTLVYDYILTIPPTSVEAERAFSLSGMLCTKIRSSLNDETLYNLCFLRAYFNNK